MTALLRASRLARSARREYSDARTAGRILASVRGANTAFRLRDLLGSPPPPLGEEVALRFAAAIEGAYTVAEKLMILTGTRWPAICRGMVHEPRGSSLQDAEWFTTALARHSDGWLEWLASRRRRRS